MRYFSALVSLAVGLNLLSGCAVLNPSESHFALWQRDSIEDGLERLVSARSIEEIDVELEKVFESKSGQKTIERLLAGWGKHDAWYDLVVVHYIWQHWPSYYGGSDQPDPEPLITAICARIHEQPELLSQIFWYARWLTPRLSFKSLCEVCEGPGSCCRISGEEFPWILLVASAIRERNVIDYDPPCSTDRSWHRASLYFLSVRPFLRFDSEKIAYVIDDAARSEGRYLSPEEQEARSPTTPLPDWKGHAVPARPEKK